VISSFICYLEKVLQKLQIKKEKCYSAHVFFASFSFFCRKMKAFSVFISVSMKDIAFLAKKQKINFRLASTSGFQIKVY